MMEDNTRSIGEIFDKCQDFVLSVNSFTNSQNIHQETIETTICCLQDLSREMMVLDLFSANEDLDEIQTGHLKFLLISCFLGYLITLHNNPEIDRLTNLEIAEDHFTEFISQMKAYGIHSVSSTVTAVSSDSSNDLSAQMKSRQLLIKKHKEKAALEDRITVLKQRQACQDVDDEIIRDLRLAELKFWSFRAEEELDFIKKEKPMLKHMEELKAKGENPGRSKTEHRIPSSVAQKSSLKPVILTRSQLEKRVFGAGYPSLPTMTVEEWYDQMVGQGQLPERGVSSRATAGGTKDEKRDLTEENDDFDALKKAREWDEYKDDHRTGWGNTFNKG